MCEPLNGDSVLHLRARRNDFKELQYSIRNGVVDELNNRGETPLMVAAQNSAACITLSLLKRGADPNSQDNDGNTPLHHGVLASSHRIVAVLRRYNADVNIPNNDGKTPLHLAAEINSTDIISELAKSTFTLDTTVRSKTGETALISAVKRGLVRTVRHFMKSNFEDSADDEGKTALHWACTFSNPTVVKLLITTNNIEHRDNNGLTPLATAVLANNALAFDILYRSSANLYTRDSAGDTLLHMACRLDNVNILKHLVSCDLYPHNEPQNFKKETPMHTACKVGSFRSFTYLLSLDHSVSAIDDLGRTPLMIAIANNSIDVAAAILNAPASELNPVNINSKDAGGNTALHYCSMYDNVRIASMLLNRGASLHELNLAGYSPCTMLSQFSDPLHSAVYQQVYVPRLADGSLDQLLFDVDISEFMWDQIFDFP